MMRSSLIMCSSILFTTLAWGAAPEPGEAAPEHKPPGWQPAPSTTSEWADRCTDFTVNGWGFKDPKNFVKLMELFSNPAIYVEFSRRMQDPESYARIAGLMMDPATAKNYMEWTDPVIYTKWMQASMDPTFYAAAMRPFMDPSTYLRWMALPMDQGAWSVGLNMMNPAMWMKWMTAGMNPKVMEPLAKAADPNTSIKWLQTASDPASFQAWTEWLRTPDQSNAFNPFNPGAWFGTPGSTNQTPKPNSGEANGP